MRFVPTISHVNMCTCLPTSGLGIHPMSTISHAMPVLSTLCSQNQTVSISFDSSFQSNATCIFISVEQSPRTRSIDTYAIHIGAGPKHSLFWTVYFLFGYPKSFPMTPRSQKQIIMHEKQMPIQMQIRPAIDSFVFRLNGTNGYCTTGNGWEYIAGWDSRPSAQEKNQAVQKLPIGVIGVIVLSAMLPQKKTSVWNHQTSVEIWKTKIFSK